MVMEVGWFGRVFDCVGLNLMEEIKRFALREGGKCRGDEMAREEGCNGKSCSRYT